MGVGDAVALWACFGGAEQHSPGTDGQGGLSLSQPGATLIQAREMQPGLTDPGLCQTQTSPLPSGLPYPSSFLCGASKQWFHQRSSDDKTP